MSESASDIKGEAVWDLVVVGGGAAGFFAAISAAEESQSSARILILEKSPRVLAKVKISGGGRCNVTHACHDPKELATNYPRGEKSLIGPLYRWGVEQTIDWFESRGVPLKTESDGRMFPVTDQSQTVIDCLVRSAEDAGVVIKTGAAVESVARVGSTTSGEDRFSLECSIGKETACVRARSLLLATGGIRADAGAKFAAALGHSAEPGVPSLFTFHVENEPRISGLQGLSVPEVALSVPVFRLKSEGPILVTHWGLSGPAVLRLSAWGARELHHADYHFDLQVDWLPGTDVPSECVALRKGWSKKKIAARSPFEPIPKRLWERLVAAAGIPELTTWCQLSNQQMTELANQLRRCLIKVGGKSLNKEEFVTCGGIPLREVDLRTMESRSVPGLYFAGEILDVDGLTGGFNFQNAWTSGYLAGSAIASGE